MNILRWTLKIVTALFVLGIIIYIVKVNGNYGTGKIEYICYENCENLNPVMLDDGTKAWLNSNAMLNLSNKFSRKNRITEIMGGVYFEIAPDTAMKFIIKTENSVIEAKGHVFVHSVGENATIMVEKGEAIWYIEGEKVNAIFSDGEIGRYSSFTGKIYKFYNQDPNFLAWQSKNLVFNHSDLYQICQTLNRVYNASIILSSVPEGMYKYSGEFNGATLKDILTILEFSLGIKFQQSQSSEIILKSE